MTYIKLAALIGLIMAIGAVYFYGYSSGKDAERIAQQEAIEELQKEQKRVVDKLMAQQQITLRHVANRHVCRVPGARVAATASTWSPECRAGRWWTPLRRRVRATRHHLPAVLER